MKKIFNKIKNFFKTSDSEKHSLFGIFIYCLIFERIILIATSVGELIYNVIILIILFLLANYWSKL